MSTAVIVGAGPGLGRAIAHRFGAEGFDIALIGRTGKTVDKVAAGLADAGRTRLQQASQAQHDVEDILFARLDQRQREQLRQLLLIVRDDLTDGRQDCATPASLDKQHRRAGLDNP